MRVMVDIDEGILRTAKDLARLKHQSLGRVISDLVQRGLMPRPIRLVETRNGVPLLRPKIGARPITCAHVKALLELDD
jgi:hypothetical protein